MIYCLFSLTIKRDQESFYLWEWISLNPSSSEQFQKSSFHHKRYWLIDKTFMKKSHCRLTVNRNRIELCRIEQSDGNSKVPKNLFCRKKQYTNELNYPLNHVIDGCCFVKLLSTIAWNNRLLLSNHYNKDLFYSHKYKNIMKIEHPINGHITLNLQHVIQKFGNYGKCFL